MTDAAQYTRERSAAYDRILNCVQKQIDALPAPITTNLTILGLSSARDAAARDALTLFKNGIQHLKSGGQLDGPGSFAEAVSKASLRSANIASTLGVKPPRFEENYYNVEFDSGAAEAVWRSRRLLEAVEADAEKSKQFIRQRLALTQGLTMPDKTEVQDPELKGIFDAAGGAAKKESEDALMSAIRRQTVLSFNLLSDLYPQLALRLKEEIAELFSGPPPKPVFKGQTFEF